jgi:hypothetical protein
MILNSLAWNRLPIYLALFVGLSAPAFGASFRTPNFIVTAPTKELAREIGERAEECRNRQALEWFGVELPTWVDPCPISATVGSDLKLQGWTSYVFLGGRPVSWQMQVQGPRAGLLRSVIPHEVNHAIFATYFGRRLPRWAEEGACVSVEHRRERGDLENLLPRQLDVDKVMGLDQMFTLREYPANVLPLYAQGYSLVSFLLTRGGKHKFVDFLRDGTDNANWAAAAQRHYGHATLLDLQMAWLQWAAPSVPRAGTLVADAK